MADPCETVLENTNMFSQLKAYMDVIRHTSHRGVARLVLSLSAADAAAIHGAA
jgi:hypothetical protein